MKRFDWSENEDWHGLDIEERIATLKSAVALPDLAEICGYEPSTTGKIRPPWNPDERTPSCHLYEDHFFDFSTGKHGDLFDFMNEVDLAEKGAMRQFARGKGNLLDFLRHIALKGGREPGDVERQPIRKVEDLSALLPPSPAVTVAGLDVRPFGLTMDGDGTVWVPHATPELVYGIKLRHAGGSKTSVTGSQFTYKLYSPVGWDPRLSHFGATAVICEGESDSWALWHQLQWLGVDVYALPSGASSWKDAWRKDLEPYSQVLVCTDNDRAGDTARDKVISKIGHDKARALMVPPLYNDAREAIEAGWRPRA